MIVHQSDLSSFNRCGEQHRRNLSGQDGKQLSATAYGTVLHHALHTLERERDLQLALNTFDHYWHPHNIEILTRPVEEWIANQSYGVLRAKGSQLLKRYWDLKQYDDEEELLGLEIPFVVSLPGTWDPDLEKPHELGGTVDRLALRRVRGKIQVCIDDWKSGRKKTYLKHALQFTAYAHATTEAEFWIGNPEHFTEGFGERGWELFDRLQDSARHGWWIDVSGTTPKWNDCGVKTHRDYQRFLRAVDNYTAARRHQIFPLAYDGEVCQFCPFRDDCPEGITNP